MQQRTKATLGTAAITGAAVAAAYYLYGSDKAKEHRKQLAGWAKTAEREIVQKAKQLKKAALTDESIKGVISEVARRYEMTKNLDPKDVRDFVDSMQKGFREARSVLSKKVRSTRAKVTTKAKKVRRAVKK